MTGVTLQAITVLGHDRPGIIAETTRILADLGLNIEDSTMTLLRGHFAMMLISAGPAGTTEIEQTLATRAVDTAGATTFATDYGEDAYLIAHSDRRTDAIVLGDGTIIPVDVRPRGAPPPLWRAGPGLSGPSRASASLCGTTSPNAMSIPAERW